MRSIRKIFNTDQGVQFTADEFTGLLSFLQHRKATPAPMPTAG